MKYPFVSFVTMTCNRPASDLTWLVEEAVESFRRNRDDYPGRCEMILANDATGQNLLCDEPGVKVINHPNRFLSLGEKLNHAIFHAAGEVILPADDDDISLPWRARMSAEKLYYGGNADYFNPRTYWVCNRHNIPDTVGDHFWWTERELYPGEARGVRPVVYSINHESMTGYAHNVSAFRKSAWFRLGGYPKISGPQDALMDAALRRGRRGVLELAKHLSLQPAAAAEVERWAGALPDGGCQVVDGPLAAPETFAIYRWGVSNFHHSAFHPNGEDAYAEYGRRTVLAGDVRLRSHWRSDYTQLTREALGRVVKK